MLSREEILDMLRTGSPSREASASEFKAEDLAKVLRVSGTTARVKIKELIQCGAVERAASQTLHRIDGNPYECPTYRFINNIAAKSGTKAKKAAKKKG
jgi:hypothetical protein